MSANDAKKLAILCSLCRKKDFVSEFYMDLIHKGCGRALCGSCQDLDEDARTKIRYEQEIARGRFFGRPEIQTGGGVWINAPRGWYAHEDQSHAEALSRGRSK